MRLLSERLKDEWLCISACKLSTAFPALWLSCFFKPAEVCRPPSTVEQVHCIPCGAKFLWIHCIPRSFSQGKFSQKANFQNSFIDIYQALNKLDLAIIMTG